MHDVFGSTHLQHAAAHVLISSTHGLNDSGDGDVERQQTRGVHLDLVLLLESAERGNLRNAGHRRKCRAHNPILQTP